MTAIDLGTTTGRADRLYDTARLVLDVASAALTAAGIAGIDRRFVAPGPPSWDTPMLTVWPARIHLGFPGNETIGAPPPGDATWAVQTVNLACQVVDSCYPTGGRNPTGAPDATQIEASAKRLMRATWAVFTALIYAHETDQLGACAALAMGAADTAGQAQAGYAGYTIAVSMQL